MIFKSKIKRNFEIKDMGHIYHYLDILVLQNIDENILTLSQSSYLESILKHFNMFN